MPLTENKRDCPYLDGCPIFKYFQRHAKKAYMSMYCQGFYDDCKRRELRLAGESVPETLLPNGCHLFGELAE